MRAKLIAALGAAALTLGLAACGGGSDAPTPPTGGTSNPPPSGGQSGQRVDVIPCLVQQIGQGAEVSNLSLLVSADTLKVDLGAPAGFPNGRRLTDPVIDLTLAVLFLDLRRHPVTTLADLPLNPRANDRPFRDAFPYLAPPQGNPPLPPTGGSNFNFRTDPASAYVRVDRTALPALSTALIPVPQRNAFNDDDPVDDATGKYLPSIIGSLEALSAALADDFDRAGLSRCARLCEPRRPAGGAALAGAAADRRAGRLRHRARPRAGRARAAAAARRADAARGRSRRDPRWPRPDL
jgi:hypothetical protein